MNRRIVGRWVVWLVVAAVVGFVALVIIEGAFHWRVGTAATPADAPIKDLPADATQIAYWLPPGIWPARLYEFNISEAGYRQWVADKDIDGMSEIKEWSGDRDDPWGGRSVRAYSWEDGTWNRKLLYHALVATWQSETSPDCGLSMIYDLDTGRAYYYSHSR
jgi:hypothetical protein